MTNALVTSTPPPSMPIFPDAETLARWRSALLEYEDQGRELLARNPLESLLALVAGGALVYYAAERGRNANVKNYWDALEFVSTCASVGYSKIFPETPVGKIVASALFLVGPTLTSRVLDPPATAPSSDSPAPPSQEAILSALNEILTELRRLNDRNVL